MSIASFKHDEMDQTAMIAPTMKTDLNGEKCALIKVVTTQKDFTFDVGSLGITEVEKQNSEHPGEIWIYVPHGVKMISIQHPQFGVIKDYDLGGRLKKGCTYVLELTSDQVNTLVVDYENSQMLDVYVTPHNAELYINGLKQNLNNVGRTSIQLPFGTHNYRVVAKDYHPEESRVLINDKNKHHTLSVNLKQAFGYLDINSSSESKGGEVYIDDTKIGELPVSHYPLKSGNHNLTIYKKLFSPFKEKIVMTDSATVVVTPIFTPNYANYEIIIEGDKEAQIYDNGVLIGTGSWKGPLEAGEHQIEVKKESHRPVSEKITVAKDMARRISLSAPTPIYGGLEVKTEPQKALIYLDGNNKPLGSTDFIDKQILIGKHHVKIMLPGHKTEEFDVDVKEGEIERIKKRLIDYCDFTLSSEPPATLLVDGDDLGITPVQISRTAGSYQVTLTARGYSTYSKKMNLDGNIKDMTIKLKRNYTRSNEFYLQVGAGFTGITSVNFGAGFYIKNVNIEGNYILGLTGSDKIYWSNATEESVPFVATYKPSGGNIKAGYGFRVHSRIRLTPQVGCQFIRLKENAQNLIAFEGYEHITDNSMEAAEGANAVSASFGLRCNVAIAPCLGVSVSPEYLIGISKSNGFKALSDISTKIKGYADGFNCSVSLNLFF